MYFNKLNSTLHTLTKFFSTVTNSFSNYNQFNSHLVFVCFCLFFKFSFIVVFLCVGFQFLFCLGMGLGLLFGLFIVQDSYFPFVVLNLKVLESHMPDTSN